MHLLLIEDHHDLAASIGEYLEEHGQTVDYAGDGLTGLHLCAVNRYDAIILDLNLPGLDGVSLCQRLRADARSAVPVLMLTARDTERDKLTGFDAGADDYLTKPFGAPELIARVKALMRRAKQYTKEATTPSFSTGDLMVDFSQHQALRAGEPINLTPTEYRILAHLARNAGRVVTQDDLLTKVWGPAYRDEAHLLRVNIARLRQKVEPEPSNPRYVITRPGIGYSLTKLEAEGATL
jgi:DNA-binding response OmpR family regulator